MSTPPEAKPVQPVEALQLPEPPRHEHPAETLWRRFGSLVAAIGAGGIVALVALIYQSGQVIARIGTAETQMAARIVTAEERINARMDAIETRLTKRMDDRFDLAERRLSRVEDRMWPAGVPPMDSGFDAGSSTARDAATVDAPPAIEQEARRLRRVFPGVRVTRAHEGETWSLWVQLGDAGSSWVRASEDGGFVWYDMQGHQTAPPVEPRR